LKHDVSEESKKLKEFDLVGKKYSDVRKYFKDLWG